MKNKKKINDIIADVIDKKMAQFKEKQEKEDNIIRFMKKIANDNFCDLFGCTYRINAVKDDSNDKLISLSVDVFSYGFPIVDNRRTYMRYTFIEETP